jgi:fumarate hydratase subunit beta
MVDEVRLTTPVTEAQVRGLKVSSVVYLSGVVYTMRDMGHRRAAELIRRGERLPFPLRGGAIWHCGPVVRRAGEEWVVAAAGPTSSSRFTELGATLLREGGARLFVGKGSMGQTAADAMREYGAAFLMATGGCAALYSRMVLRVREVYWLDLGMPEATWVLEVKNLGPLIVGIDAEGRSLQEEVRCNVRENLECIYRDYKIDPGYDYVWRLRGTIGTRDASEKI